MNPTHIAAALLMVTIWGGALRACPLGAYVEIPLPAPREPLR